MGGYLCRVVHHAEPFALYGFPRVAGGAAAIWVEAMERAGVVNLTATHPILGSRSIAIRVIPAEADLG